jgi:1,2-dihydroxy-3-keto-5-methylthiopentene dioxygenase
LFFSLFGWLLFLTVSSLRDRNYKNHDFVLSKNIPNLAEKLETFKTEHLHYDEEIRFMIDGSGFFDIKDENDRWVRIVTEKGNMIVLPAGAFHRFVPDEKLYFHAMRLFQDE